LLLPDSAFSSWEWKLNDRMKWYKEIKENNFYIDKDPDYFNQSYFEPSKAGFTIVDGFGRLTFIRQTKTPILLLQTILLETEIL